MFMQGTQGYSRLVTVFLGTLWSSIKEVKAPFMFDMEHGIALHAMPVNQASSHGEGDVSWLFSSYDWNGPKTLVCSAMTGLLSSSEGHLQILLEAWKGNRDSSRGEAGDPGSLSSCCRDIGIHINFQESGILSF